MRSLRTASSSGAKSYDTFAPIGPALTVNEFTPNDAKLELHVNSIRKQQSTTRNFIFELEELLTFITSMMTLHPGDVISTGTPADVGIFRDPPDLLKPGDSVEASIEGLGRSRTTRCPRSSSPARLSYC